MITRYSRPEMRAIWTDENKLRIWLQIELLASEALAAEGVVSKADFAKLKAGAARQGAGRTTAHADDYGEGTAQNPHGQGGQQEHAGDAKLCRHLKVVV